MIKKDEVGRLHAFILDPSDTSELWPYLYEEFDADADEYSRKYHDLQGQLKALKKYLAIKLLCLPIELPLAYIMLGRLEAKIKIKTYKKLWAAIKSEHLTAEEMVKVYDLC